MHPESTVYRIADELDEDRLLDWLREKMGIISHIGWPTLIAERDGELQGCIVSQSRSSRIVQQMMMTLIYQCQIQCSGHITQIHMLLVEERVFTFSIKEDLEWMAQSQNTHTIMQKAA